MKKYLLFITFIVLIIFSSFIFLGCTIQLDEENENTGTVYITVSFPEETESLETKSVTKIPTGTKLFEIAIQKGGESTWMTKVVEGAPGETKTVILNVSEGTYKVHIIAKDLSTVLAFGKAENVIVEKDKITSITVTLHELFFDFSDTLKEASSGELISLEFTLKVPHGFSDDFFHSGIWLHGYITNYLSDNVPFMATLENEISQIDGVEYETITFTSGKFNAPIVDLDTEFEWHMGLYITTDKWQNYQFDSQKQILTVKAKVSGISIIIN
jgi:hypothetical protein